MWFQTESHCAETALRHNRRNFIVTRCVHASIENRQIGIGVIGLVFVLVMNDLIRQQQPV